MKMTTGLELDDRIQELEMQLREGIAAAREVVASWDNGDLAGAVNNLSHWAGEAKATLY